MNIIIDIAHPAHVHLLRNFYHDMTQKGHKVVVTCKHIPAAMQLLDLYHIPYIYLGEKKDNILLKALEQLKYNIKLLRIARREGCSIAIGTSITLAHVGALSHLSIFRKPISAILLDDDDDEVEPLYAKFAHPFADIILTPDSIKRKAQQALYYAGTHELAYLHPNRFQPDDSILRELGVKAGEKFFVIRFNAFKAHHDVGAKGLSIEGKRRLIRTLEQYGRVFITTERNIDDEFLPYQLKVSQEKVHSLMYYATMFIGDSQTMTSEAAILGTPAVKCNSFAGRLAVPNELEERYGLCYAFLPEDEGKFFMKIDELLAMPDLKKEWAKRRAHFLSEKIDVTAFLVYFIEGYPATVKEVKNADENFWKRFK